MRNIIIILFVLVSSNLLSQPTGEERIAIVNLYFLDNLRNDTIFFQKIENRYISLDKKNEIQFFSQDYILDIDDYEKKYQEFKQIHKIDSISFKWEEKFIKDSVKEYPYGDLIDNKYFRIIYSPSIKRIGHTTIEPSKDILITYKKNRCEKMKIYLKLYDVKSEFEMDSHVDIVIPFRQGTYEITKIKSPQLITIGENE